MESGAFTTLVSPAVCSRCAAAVPVKWSAVVCYRRYAYFYQQCIQLTLIEEASRATARAGRWIYSDATA